MTWRIAIAAILAGSLWAAAAAAQSPAGNPKTGRVFALGTCTPCHVVTARQVAPPRLAIAPSFQSIANMESTTALSLQAFLASPHPSMPNLILTPTETANVVAYILSLRGRH